MTSVLAGPWQHYGRLTGTPMTGTMINVVATDPSKWTWLQRTPMVERDAWADAVSQPTFGAGKIEVASGRLELWTAGVRNILLALTPPRSSAELAAAVKYDEIIVPDLRNLDWWAMNTKEWTAQTGRCARMVNVPIGEPDDHERFAEYVTGES